MLGPFICHKDISLTEGERAILSKDRKFCLTQDVDRIEFNMELERSLVKHRFNEQGEKAEREKMDKISIGVSHIENEKACSSNVPEQDEDRLTKLWDLESHRYIFDPFKKEIDFSKSRPTDYKLNTRIKLPKPLSTDEEFQCETRKRVYMKVCDDFIKTKDSESRTVNKDHQKETEKHTLDHGKNRHKNKKFLNIDKKESVGLINLQKRIRNNEIVVTPTDKSGRFSVMTHQQYIEAGHEHTNKDIPTDWAGVRYLKNQVNNHMWWLTKIWSYSKQTDQDRMLNNLTVAGLDLPEMYLLTKDHK